MKITNVLLVLATFFAFAVSLWIVPKANAVPAFARQTGLACSTCHFQHFPALTAFGRAFKAGGYTQIGGEGMVEGEDLSIPDTLNASLVAKVRYQKTNGKDYGTPANTNGSSGTNKGELQFPDEAALFLAGRGGEHIGFLLEGQVKDNTAPMFANFKMPVVYDVGPAKLSIIPFTTDGGGPAYGFELLNTGAISMHTTSVREGNNISAQSFIGVQTEAEGFAFVASNDMGYINYTVWAPVHGATDTGPYLSYLRLAATPKIGDFDIGAGIQWWGGTTKRSTTTTTQTADLGTGVVTSSDTTSTNRSSADAWAVDAQVQGNVGLPLGVYLTYGDAKKSKTNEVVNMFNSSTTGDKKAWSLLAEVGVLPGKATVGLGYRAGNNGAAANNKQNAKIVGVTYLVAQNVQLVLNHAIYNGSYYDLAANNEQANGDRLTTLMLFAAF